MTPSSPHSSRRLIYTLRIHPFSSASPPQLPVAMVTSAGSGRDSDCGRRRLERLTTRLDMLTMSQAPSRARGQLGSGVRPLAQRAEAGSGT